MSPRKPKNPLIRIWDCRNTKTEPLYSIFQRIPWLTQHDYRRETFSKASGQWQEVILRVCSQGHPFTKLWLAKLLPGQSTVNATFRFTSKELRLSPPLKTTGAEFGPKLAPTLNLKCREVLRHVTVQVHQPCTATKVLKHCS